MTTIIIHLVFISSLFTGFLNSLFHDTSYLVGQGADFFSYYQAGNNILNGLDCYIVPESAVVPYLYPYRYLPYFAYSFGAIANLTPPFVAYWLWVGIVTFSVWLAALRTRSLAKALQRPDWEGRIAMGMWFMFSPIYIELYLGQVTLFAAILIFFAFTTPSLVDGGDSEFALTIFWIIGSFIKLIPLLAAPALLGAGKARSVLVAAMALVLAVVAVPRGLESLQFFLGFNTARTVYISPYVGSHSLNMLLYYLLGGGTNDFRVITGLLIGLTLFPATIVTLYSRDVWSCAGLYLTTYFFIITDVWEHHYTLILPLLVLAWIRGKPESKARWVPLALAILLSVPTMPIVQFLSGSGPGVHPIAWAVVWQVVYHSSKVVPALVFYGWLLVTAFRSARQENTLESVLEAFQQAWNGLLTGRSPTAKAGIIVRTEDR